MADTVFNIFGSLSVQKQLAPKTLGENVNVLKKLGATTKGVTPSKINRNIATPKFNDPKRKTFFQNEGASIQSFRQTGDVKKTSQPMFKKTLQVYEDEIVTPKPEDDFDEMLKIEYNRKPIVDDDACDDEMAFTKEQVDQLIFGLPNNNHPFTPMFDEPKMLMPQMQGCDDFNDLLPDDETELNDCQFIVDDILIPM
ncbi:uncharacterized protein LOC143916666 [Arctopsyche grandis]|uniref:uncharacterized protein LOC143916666 n=1 Tax=Arctopsyche grandis TaxID=121162 RepID=UPI00406DA3EA